MVNITKKVGKGLQQTVEKTVDTAEKTVSDATSRDVSESDARHVMLGALTSPLVAMAYRKFSKWVLSIVPKKWSMVVNISSVSLPFLTAGLVKRIKPVGVNLMLGTLYGVGFFNVLGLFMDLGGKSVKTKEKPAEETFQKVIGINSGGFFPKN